MATEANSAIAEFDRRNQEMADWRSMSHRVLPDVRSMSDYRVNSTKGLFSATLNLRREVRPPPNPTAAELLAAHKTAYGTCVKDAGAFRKPGEFATFSGFNGAEAQRVPIELERLRQEMAELLAAAKTPQQKAAAIAFYNLRFVAIHPFMDGNGRLGRAVMATQVEKILGVSARPLMQAIADNKAKYIAASETALRTNNIAPLTAFIAESLAIEPPQERDIQSPFKLMCRRMMALGDIKPIEEERRMAATGAGLPLEGQGGKDLAPDHGIMGVPFVVLAPLRLGADGKGVPDEAIARLREQATPCQSYFIQIHTADGQVYHSPAHNLARSLAEWQAKDAGFRARLASSITVGLTAKDHEALLDRCNREGKPFPSAYADVSTDRALRASDPSHKSRFLSHAELRATCQEGCLDQIDPKSLTHRLAELYHIGHGLDKARAEFNDLCQQVSSMRRDPILKSPSQGEPSVAAGSALLDQISTALEAPAPIPGELTRVLEQHFSNQGTLPAAARDNVIAGSFGRQPDGQRATVASVAAHIEQSLPKWRENPDNKRRTTADFVVDHFASSMTAAGVRGLAAQMDPADQRRYGQQLACDHPSLGWARSVRSPGDVSKLTPEQIQVANKSEEMATSRFLIEALGGRAGAVNAIASRPGQPAPRSVEDAAAQLVATRRAWLLQVQGAGDPATNSTFLAGYLEQHLKPEALSAYKERMNPPMRLWHENRLAEIAAHPSRRIPEAALAPTPVAAEVDAP